MGENQHSPEISNLDQSVKNIQDFIGPNVGPLFRVRASATAFLIDNPDDPQSERTYYMPKNFQRDHRLETSVYTTSYYVPRAPKFAEMVKGLSQNLATLQELVKMQSNWSFISRPIKIGVGRDFITPNTIATMTTHTINEEKLANYIRRPYRDQFDLVNIESAQKFAEENKSVSTYLALQLVIAPEYKARISSPEELEQELQGTGFEVNGESLLLGFNLLVSKENIDTLLEQGVLNEENLSEFYESVVYWQTALILDQHKKAQQVTRATPYSYLECNQVALTFIPYIGIGLNAYLASLPEYVQPGHVLDLEFYRMRYETYYRGVRSVLRQELSELLRTPALKNGTTEDISLLIRGLRQKLQGKTLPPEVDAKLTLYDNIYKEAVVETEQKHKDIIKDFIRNPGKWNKRKGQDMIGTITDIKDIRDEINQQGGRITSVKTWKDTLKLGHRYIQ